METGSTKNGDGRVLPFAADPELTALIEERVIYEAPWEERSLLEALRGPAERLGTPSPPKDAL